MVGAPPPAALPLTCRLFNCHPFTAFFLLFSAIIRNPSARESTEVDLPLMRQLVAYFAAMQDRSYESAARLRSVAAAFTNVAITYLTNYRAQQHDSSRKRRRGNDDAPADSYEHEDEPAPLPELYPPASTAVRNPAFTGVATAAAAAADDTAAFLRWQNGVVMACDDGGTPDMDALVSEPLGFQMRMEVGGPLDFDWFGWEEAQVGEVMPGFL